MSSPSPAASPSILPPPLDGGVIQTRPAYIPPPKGEKPVIEYENGSSARKDTLNRIIVGVVAVSVGMIIIVGIFVFLCRRGGRKKRYPQRKGKNGSTMNWSTRMKIAIGSAKGLAYLHEDCHPKIIHRDIKAANILLDDSFEAKVADFGLAKFWSDADTHVSTRVMGTFGYMAPEYAASGKLTEKSDVYSFGIVLLELITGRKPVDRTASFTDDSMVEWARPLLSQALENGNINGLVDQCLGTNYNPEEMIRMIASAARCILFSARRRPRMSEVVRALEGNFPLDDLNKESAPWDDRGFGYDSDQYNEDLKNFEKLALESQEPSTSEFRGSSGKYSQHLSALTSSNQQNTPEMEMGNVMVGNHGSGPSGVSA
ncbi:hypothetical protein RIF29_28793 [Crotalaria pallida]|uniref:non-specific serine/threonine protein kinase n=1 Tax=Crotalaria pallida TaxID=3830 RepID=A0AAN9HVN2_CROPI